MGGGAYTSAEMQSAYFIAPADRAIYIYSNLFTNEMRNSELSQLVV